MSDTFDHEWDAWESRFTDGFYSDDDDYSPYGRSANPTCNRCGSTAVYWSQNENGDWRLYEEGKRIQPGNRKMLHSCSQAEPDDFEVVE